MNVIKELDDIFNEKCLIKILQQYYHELVSYYNEDSVFTIDIINYFVLSKFDLKAKERFYINNLIFHINDEHKITLTNLSDVIICTFNTYTINPLYIKILSDNRIIFASYNIYVWNMSGKLLVEFYNSNVERVHNIVEYDNYIMIMGDKYILYDKHFNKIKIILDKYDTDQHNEEYLYDSLLIYSDVCDIILYNFTTDEFTKISMSSDIQYICVIGDELYINYDTILLIINLKNNSKKEINLGDTDFIVKIVKYKDILIISQGWDIIFIKENIISRRQFSFMVGIDLFDNILEIRNKYDSHLDLINLDIFNHINSDNIATFKQIVIKGKSKLLTKNVYTDGDKLNFIDDKQLVVKSINIDKIHLENKMHKIEF